MYVASSCMPLDGECLGGGGGGGGAGPQVWFLNTFIVPKILCYFLSFLLYS